MRTKCDTLFEGGGGGGGEKQKNLGLIESTEVLFPQM